MLVFCMMVLIFVAAFSTNSSLSDTIYVIIVLYNAWRLLVAISNARKNKAELVRALLINGGILAYCIWCLF